MQTIGIETAQNVMVQHEVASVGDRIVAALLDNLVLLAWMFLLFISGVFTAGLGGDGVAVAILIVLALLPYMFYDLVCEIAMDGQSIGKRARKIRVVRMDGGQPRIGQYLLRWILRPIDSFYYLGLVVILINGKGQRLGDLAAGTCVVSLKQRLKLQDTLMTTVSVDHQVRYPEAIRLSDAQAALIKELLNNTKVGNRAELMRQMAERVSQVIGNADIGPSPQQFLRYVLQDYVHLTGQAGRATSR
ncbi:MAG: RDD family protein [Flavobacteriales bacterium]|nr:RDD family protein [Flavobacteriales bacterium]